MIEVMDNYNPRRAWDEPEDMTEAVMLMKRRSRGEVVDEYLLNGKHVVQIMFWKGEFTPESVYVIGKEE